MAGEKTVKILRIYKCLNCEHQVKVKGIVYRSPCPICNGPMVLYYVMAKGGEVLESSLRSLNGRG